MSLILVVKKEKSKRLDVVEAKLAAEVNPVESNGNVVPPAAEAVEKRPVWDNQIQFILATIGLSVGLGNVWKFPAVAFANGGSAFLFPYLLCALIFALPLIYMEFTIGQYTNASPAMAFRKYGPAFEGLGWAMVLMCGQVAIFYTLVVAWTGIYMAWIVTGNQYKWTDCGNQWNTKDCSLKHINSSCVLKNSRLPYLNASGSCVSQLPGLRSASEEFFTEKIVNKSSGFSELDGIRWETLIALVIMWIIVYLIIIKGIKYIGYAAYVTSTVPYLIIAIMFARGVTLEGASEGIYFYLGAPDWSKLMSMKTWLDAVSQLLFSLSIGFGALISLSSYSKSNNPCFRDALILFAGDTFMSVFGGVAVFSTLGHLAHKMGKPVKDVVTGGPALVFVTYPEVLAKMPVAFLWAGLFFLMLLLLGLSTLIAIVDVQCSSIYDLFPRTRKMDWLVSGLVCIVYFLIGSIFATGCGWYYFIVASEFTGTTGTCIIVALEAIIIGFVYGKKNYREDQIVMFGEPNTWFNRIATSPIWGWALVSTCPLIALVIGIATMYKFISVGSMVETDKLGTGTYTYPALAMFFGWFLNLAPLLLIPIVAGVNWLKIRREGKDIWELFRVQTDHPSYERINRIYGVVEVADPGSSASISDVKAPVPTIHMQSNEAPKPAPAPAPEAVPGAAQAPQP